MQYRTMPKTGDQVSLLGFGCMRLPTRVGGEASSLIDKDKALAQIKMAIDQGVNYFDTAFPYHLGASETFLGEHVLSTDLRNKIKIATKLPCMSIFREESIEEIFDKQIKKLQVDYIDYYLLHALDGIVWDRMVKLGIKDFMDKIKKEGKVINMGFSFHGKRSDFLRIVDSYDWDFVQVQYNMLDENFQAGVEGIEYAHSKKMGVIVMEPLRGGSLVGQIPLEVQKLYDTSEVKRKPVDWALRWVMNHPAVTCVLSGMNNEDHIRENINVACDALPNGLDEQELAIIDSVRDTYDRLLQVGCTGCAYCMPCPAGIDIPSAFKQLNNYHMFSKMSARLMHIAYAGVQNEDGKAHWTSSCIDCGKCEQVCPQNIDIRNEFPKIQRNLEGPAARVFAAVGRRFMNR